MRQTPFPSLFKTDAPPHTARTAPEIVNEKCQTCIERWLGHGCAVWANSLNVLYVVEQLLGNVTRSALKEGRYTVFGFGKYHVRDFSVNPTFGNSKYAVRNALLTNLPTAPTPPTSFRGLKSHWLPIGT